jgi:hypothetical protein
MRVSAKAAMMPAAPPINISLNASFRTIFTITHGLARIW